MKMERILSILYYLMNRDKVTINELAEKFEVSRRTIFRDLDTLNMAGFPVASYPGHGGGVGLIEGFKIDKKVLSEYDISNILVGLNSLKNLGDDQKLNYLIEKLIPAEQQDSFLNSDIIVDLSSWFSEDVTSNTLLDFRKAVSKNRYVMMEYHSITKYSKRKVEPYKLVFKYDNWYLHAFCMERIDFRIFKVNRISSYTILDESFVPKASNLVLLNIEPPLKSQFEDNQPPVKVVFKYQSKDKQFLIDKFGAQNFRDNGTTGTIEFSSNNLEWTIYFAMGLQDKIKVIEPEELRKEIIKRIKKMADLYNM